MADSRTQKPEGLEDDLEEERINPGPPPGSAGAVGGTKATKARDEADTRALSKANVQAGSARDGKHETEDDVTPD